MKNVVRVRALFFGLKFGMLYVVLGNSEMHIPVGGTGAVWLLELVVLQLNRGSKENPPSLNLTSSWRVGSSSKGNDRDMKNKIGEIPGTKTHVL